MINRLIFLQEEKKKDMSFLFFFHKSFKNETNSDCLALDLFIDQ